jgi:hypothetical protein
MIIVPLRAATTAETATVQSLLRQEFAVVGAITSPAGARFVFAEEGSAIRMLRFRNASTAGRDNSILQVRTMIPGP